MSRYAQQYCKKHNQYYADFLHNCPICVGETLDGVYKGNIDDIEKKMEKAQPKKE